MAFEEPPKIEQSPKVEKQKIEKFAEEDLEESGIGETKPYSENIAEKNKNLKGIVEEIRGEEKAQEKLPESFGEMKQRIEDRIDGMRSPDGRKLSFGERNDEFRKTYLEYLGYSIADKKGSKGFLGKAKDFLQWNSMILDKEGNPIKDEKTGKILEFNKSFKSGKEESPLNKFLENELREKTYLSNRLQEEKASERIGETEPYPEDIINKNEISDKREASSKAWSRVQNKFAEDVEKRRVQTEKNPSLEERDRMLRDVYLGELGYSIENKKGSKGIMGKVRDFLQWNSMISDKEGNPIKDEKTGKILEFNKSFKSEKEGSPLNKFLENELRERDLTIKDATTFDDLRKVINKIDSMEYSTGESLSAEEIKKRIDEIRSFFDKNPDEIKSGVSAYEKSAGRFNIFRELTRKEGLRGKVKELIETEFVEKTEKDERKR